MHKSLIASLLLAAAAAQAQSPAPAPRAALCDSCATVLEVKQVQRKGEGGAVGIVGGAVVGGLLGNQIGGGSGKTLATVGGAVAGGYVGNEVQKKVTTRTVWVTRVRLKDGSQRSYEQDGQPAWRKGQTVRVDGSTILRT